MVVGCVGPREGAAPGGARTKNSGFNVIATMFNDAQVVSLQNLRLTNTKGAIGYPLRVNFAGIDPGFDVVYQTSSSNCRIDATIGLLTYVGTAAGTCDVAAIQRDQKLGGSGTVQFLPEDISSTFRNGLVGYWPFNDSSSIGWNAATGKTDLSIVGGVEFRQQGKFGGGVSLNGRSSFLKGALSGDMISSTDLPTGNSPYSISLWMKPTTFNRGGLVGWGGFDDRSGSTNLLQMSDQLMVASTDIGGGIINAWNGQNLNYVHRGERVFEYQGRTACCISSFTESKWVHVAVVYDGRSRTIYYGGRSVASDTPARPAAFVPSKFRIGAGSAKNEFFGGRLDDVAVWKRALTSAEITGLSTGALAQPNSALGANFVPYVPTPCDQQGGFCEVGDKAPDGGTVFYVGDFTDQVTGTSMKYLSFAPTDLLYSINGPNTGGSTGYQRNCGGKVHPIPETDKRDIGFGRRNTVIISNFCKESAADDVLLYAAGGSKDWFIPSAAELNELCKFAHNQATGDTSVGCSSATPLLDGWAMNENSADFLSSSQGKKVSEYGVLFGSVLATLPSGWLAAAAAVGKGTGAFENLKWGGLQAWRIGRDFLNGSQYNDDGLGSQVRPIRYFAPGSQASFNLTSTGGRVGAPIGLSTSGGSGNGAVSYRVMSAGTAGCVANADRRSVTASSVGSCTIQATKDGSGSYRVARSAIVTVEVAKGTQAALALTDVNGKAGVPLVLTARGGSGTGTTVLALADAGTAVCRMVTPTTTPPQVVSDRDGTCSVTISRAGDANYEAAAIVAVTLTFAKKDQPALTVSAATGALDAIVPLATSGGGGTGAITYSLSPGGTSGCVLASNGTAVTAESPGTCKVTATKAADTKFVAATSPVVDITFTSTVCSNEGLRPDGSACQVGDTGPGGGRVFYVSSTPINYAEGVSTGGTFLEVAPFNWAGGTSEYSNEWCRRGYTDLTLGADIGTGANNTFVLATQGNCSNNSAAKKTVDATIGGQSDWFLPSVKELNEVCKFAHRQETGNPSVACTSAGALRVDFASGRKVNRAHWSSTAIFAGGYSQDRVINLADGSAASVLEGMGSYLMVRPIRSFGAQKPPAVSLPADYPKPVPTTAVPPTTIPAVVTPTTVAVAISPAQMVVEALPSNKCPSDYVYRTKGFAAGSCAAVMATFPPTTVCPPEYGGDFVANNLRYCFILAER